MINTKDLIGIHKYNQLKRFDFEKMTAEEMVEFRKRFKLSVADAEKQIFDYEKYRRNPIEYTKKNQEYFKNLENESAIDKPELTKKYLWNRFKYYFKAITNNELIESDNYIENIKPIFYYFINDLKSFNNCKRVSKISIPSLDKGLLIVGDFGNGKSSTMKVLESCLVGTDKYFKGYSSNEVVLSFEGCETPSDKEYLIKRMSKGTLYFDDIKSERMANNYGKSELFREILENRYNNKAKTYITCNYKKGYEGDLDSAIKEFGEKYGDRVNDRIYEMFNIIEFKGKSIRK